VRENVRIAAKRAAKRASRPYSEFPEFPRVSALIPQRDSGKPPEGPIGACVPEHDADSAVFTKDARRKVTLALLRWKPRPSEEKLEAILSDLTTPMLTAKFALADGAPVEVIRLRKRLEGIEGLAKRLRRYLEALAPVEGQIALADLMRLQGARSPRELARELAILEHAAAKVRPGPQTVGHPKAGTGATRYLAGQIAGVLEKHGIHASAASGSIYEEIVRATWRCVDASAPPANMTRFLRSILR